jgi:hypothetical protein
MKNNIDFKNEISWFDIDENGSIKGPLINKPTVYIFMLIDKEKSCYVGSSVRIKNRLNCHKSRIINWDKNYYNNNGSLLFYNSIKKHG